MEQRIERGVCLLGATVGLLGCIVSSDPAPVTPPASNPAGVAVGDQGGRLLSADGVLLVSVPAGAGAPDTMAITAVDPASLAGTFDELDVVGAWEVGPSASFGQPVSLELDLSRVPGLDRDRASPLLFLSEGSGFELVADQTLVDEGPGGAFVLRGEVTHFSRIVLTNNRHMSVSFQNDDIANVGQTISSSASLSAKASSPYQALSVVVRVHSYQAVESKRMGWDAGALDGGAQSGQHAFDPLRCTEPGIGFFDVTADFRLFSTLRNGQRTRPADVHRRKEALSLCHQPSGTSTVSLADGSQQSLTVNTPSVDKRVGESFVLDITLSGRTGPQGVRVFDLLPGKISGPTAATPPTVGAAANPRVGPGGAFFDLTGNGGVRLQYQCIAPGQTGLQIQTTHQGFITVTSLVTCRAAEAPPEEDPGGD